MQPCKRLALNLGDMLVNNADAWRKLEFMCPHLEELVVILFPNPTKTTRLEDLEEVNTGNAVQRRMMAEVRHDFEQLRNLHAQAWTALVNMKLKFMKKKT
jgi:hypothetical protein